jgi:hypothetical protein
MSKTSLRLFLSYSHKDRKIHEELCAHLSPLRHQGLIVDWDDRQISPGSSWESAISSNLDRSDIIILLISSDFVNSPYCVGLEMQRALSLHVAGVSRVIPVIARPCHWENLPFAKLQALPRGGKPITTWSDRDSAFLSVVEGVEIAAQELLADSANLVNEWLSSLLLRRKVVRFVQTFLRERQIYLGAVDGEPANLQLREAVRRFQATVGLETDGLIGPRTLRAIMSQIADKK